MDDVSSFPIGVFCKRNAMSRGKFHKLKRDGKGPREMDVGGMIRISVEAEAAWRRECEAASAPREGVA
jgi:hypothetical protein